MILELKTSTCKGNLSHFSQEKNEKLSKVIKDLIQLTQLSDASLILFSNQKFKEMLRDDFLEIDSESF